MWERASIDILDMAPREWPRCSYLSEQEVQQLLDIHSSASPLNAIRDSDIKLVQRLLYYTRADLWLSEGDITLRENKEREIGGTGLATMGKGQEQSKRDKSRPRRQIQSTSIGLGLRTGILAGSGWRSLGCYPMARGRWRRRHA